MKCIVCGRDMSFYFEKYYSEYDLASDFCRCPHCGLVVNKTVYNLTSEEWQEINRVGGVYQRSDDNPYEEAWMERMRCTANVIASLVDAELYGGMPKCVDYGCGDGRLSKMIKGVSNRSIFIDNYEPFLDDLADSRDGFIGDEVFSKKYDIVINTGVIEHIVGRDYIDKMFSILSSKGIMCIHTLICEDVPKDDKWFYIESPRHCTIWTNKSMGILYDEKEFEGCAYHLQSKMWFFFREIDIMKKWEKIVVDRFPNDTWVFGNQFIDYWKGNPYK